MSSYAPTGRKPIWYDPVVEVDLSLDSDDSDADRQAAPSHPPPPPPPPDMPLMPGHHHHQHYQPLLPHQRPRMYQFPPPPKSPPPPPLPPASHSLLAQAKALANANAYTHAQPQPQAMTGGARPQPFRIYPGSSIIFQPDPSSSTSSSGEASDSSDTGTDPGSMEKLSTLLSAAIATGSSSSGSGNNNSSSGGAVVPSRILKRMSSVTLVEDDAAGANGRRVKPATNSTGVSASTSTSSAAGSDSEEKSPGLYRHESSSVSISGRQLRGGDKAAGYDTDDELRYIREVEGGSPIPLNRMTQEKVHHPRKRPVPSPAAGMRGQQQQISVGSVEYSWKRLGAVAAPSPTARAFEMMGSANPTSQYNSNVKTHGGSAPIKRDDGMADTKMNAAYPPQHLMKTEAQTGTLLVYQPTCLDHHNDTHQENRQRLGVLCGPEGVLHKERFNDLRWANLNELKPARLNDLLRVHSFEYIQHLEKACGLLPDQDEAISVGSLFATGSKDSVKDLTYADWLKVSLCLLVWLSSLHLG